VKIDVEQFKDLTTLQEVPRGSVIIEEGARQPYSMYILLKGKVAVYKNFREIRETLLATLGPGEFFGEMSLFLRNPRSATVVTLERTTFLEITPQNALEITKKFPDLSVAIIEVLCKRSKINKKAMDGLA
jgi:CRP-like cAMP-binding protein